MRIDSGGEIAFKQVRRTVNYCRFDGSHLGNSFSVYIKHHGRVLAKELKMIVHAYTPDERVFGLTGSIEEEQIELGLEAKPKRVRKPKPRK